MTVHYSPLIHVNFLSLYCNHVITTEHTEIVDSKMCTLLGDMKVDLEGRFSKVSGLYQCIYYYYY